MIRILRILIPILVLVTALLTFVRVLLTPVFVELEYRRPGFPADPFGFTLEDRLRYGEISRTYLLTNAGPDYFTPYTLTSGAPMYNERELQHMADVQRLVGQTLQVWETCAVLLLLCVCYLLWKDAQTLRILLFEAGRFTLFFILGAGVLVLLTWDQAFILFHRIFFTGSTWLFYTSDTLIRLFPIEFWQDIFLTAAAGTALTGLALMLVYRKRAA
jgi:integral membrane protein (TIGR01906 family)